MIINIQYFITVPLINLYSQLLSASTDGTVKLWSIGQQRCITTFRNHEQGVWALAVDPDWSHFYSGGREKTLFETNLKTSENTFLLKENGSILDVSRACFVSPLLEYLGEVRL